MFLVWGRFQRRSESLAKIFGLDIRYYYFLWEDRGVMFKAFAYIMKFIKTLYHLFYFRPKFVFIQLAPAPLLYLTFIYCTITRSYYISDCHNSMIYDGPFARWPFVNYLLNRSFILLVHNEDVQKIAEQKNLSSRVLLDPLPILDLSRDIREIAGVRIKNEEYFIVPGSLGDDEPITEIFEAALKVPDALILLTGNENKLSFELKNRAPKNVKFTGFLSEPEFNLLYANSKAAIVLTTREGTQPSGAAEAIALGVSLIISDLLITQKLYKNIAIFVENHAGSIAKGIERAKNNKQFSDNIYVFRDELNTKIDNQVQILKDLITEKENVIN
ncbi:MAG: hypothetical protein ACD_19C00377G0003 [uncultured bacterium]|nr:MAG: hypothetical protein ACD_19C00377G0003 [uncultured bacterium]